MSVCGNEHQKVSFSDLVFFDVSDIYGVPNAEAAMVFCSNGYGASIIHGDSFNGYEVVIVKGSPDSYAECYNSPITDSSVQWLDERGVELVLQILVSMTPPPTPWYDLAGHLENLWCKITGKDREF